MLARIDPHRAMRPGSSMASHFNMQAERNITCMLQGEARMTRGTGLRITRHIWHIGQFKIVFGKRGTSGTFGTSGTEIDV